MENKNVLERIQEFLASFETYEEKRLVWEILSAVRGPDNADFQMKRFVTIPVRSALCQSSFQLGACSSPFVDYIPRLLSEETRTDYEARIIGRLAQVSNKKLCSHFVNHAASAFYSISFLLKKKEESVPDPFSSVTWGSLE